MSTAKKKPQNDKVTVADIVQLIIGWGAVIGIIALMIWVYIQMPK